MGVDNGDYCVRFMPFIRGDALLISNLVRNRLREEGRKNEKKTFVNLKCWLLRYQLKVPG